jgi:hypothetical protein
LGPSAQPSPALETSEKNNSNIWITTYQSLLQHNRKNNCAQPLKPV